MSEYDPNSWANRKAANNDGMDPDWRPEPQLKRSLEPIKKLERLFFASEVVCEAINKISDADLRSGEFPFIKLTIPMRQAIELKDAVEAFYEPKESK